MKGWFLRKGLLYNMIACVFVCVCVLFVFYQGKEEFEKNQRQLLEKGNIIRHNKTQLEQQQVKPLKLVDKK